MVFHHLWPNTQKALGPTTSGGLIEVNNCLISCSTAHKPFVSTFVPPLDWIWELCHSMFSINTKPAYDMKDCRIWICLKCLFSVSVLWLMGSFMLEFWFEWPILDFSTKQNLLKVAWVLPTFVYTLPFVLYLGSAKLAMASHFLVRHCTIVWL